MSLVLFLTALYAMGRGTLWTLSLFGSHRVMVALLLLQWIAASLLDACRTVSPTAAQLCQQRTAAVAAPAITNGVADSADLGGKTSGAVTRGGSAAQRRGASNDLAADDISSTI